MTLFLFPCAVCFPRFLSEYYVLKSNHFWFAFVCFDFRTRQRLKANSFSFLNFSRNHKESLEIVQIAPRRGRRKVILTVLQSLNRWVWWLFGTWERERERVWDALELVSWVLFLLYLDYLFLSEKYNVWFSLLSEGLAGFKLVSLVLSFL